MSTKGCDQPDGPSCTKSTFDFNRTVSPAHPVLILKFMTLRPSPPPNVSLLPLFSMLLQAKETNAIWNESIGQSKMNKWSFYFDHLTYIKWHFFTCCRLRCCWSHSTFPSKPPLDLLLPHWHCCSGSSCSQCWFFWARSLWMKKKSDNARAPSSLFLSLPLAR